MMDNNTLLVENSPREPPVHFTGTETSLKPVIRMAKKGPMQPTPLQSSCYSRRQTEIGVGAYVLFTFLTMTIGILVVCLSVRKPAHLTCDFKLRPTVDYSNRDSSHPRSVATGDLNSDGHMDTVVANFGFDSVSIFISNGNNAFENKMTYSMGPGSAPRTVALGDLNNDARLDIVVVNSGSNSIGILLGDSKGHFPNRKMIETHSSRPLYVVVGDFNNDRFLDIAYAGYGTDRVDLLLGFGNGNFRSVTSLLTGYDSLLHAIAIGDLNNDGQLDIAVANYGTDNIGLFFGHGDGSFTTQTIHTTGADSRPSSIAIGNLNNDTYLDMVVVNTKANNLRIFLGSGNGNFHKSTSYSLRRNSNPLFVAIADFNNDNKLDITIVNNGTDKMVLLLGNGDGTFTNPREYSTGPRSSPYSIGIADFNNDDQMDVVVANYQNNNIKVFNSQTNVIFAGEITFPTSNDSSATGTSIISTGSNSAPVSLVCGDFNKDNQLDTAVANANQNNIIVILGSTNGRFSSPVSYPTGDNSYPCSIISADFNKDGQLDLAVANNNSHNVGILLGYGDGEFAPQTTYFMGTGSYPVCVVAGDFNKDNRLDIAVANSGFDTIVILLGNDDDKFFPSTACFTGSGSTPHSITVGYFNNDSHLDIAVANYGADNIGVCFGYGNGTFSLQTTYPTGIGSNPSSIATGDLNKDGLLDLVVANFGTSNVGILLGSGSGKFLSQTTHPTGADSRPISVIIADFNNDSSSDIAVANSYTNNIGTFLNYGNGTFSSQIIYFVSFRDVATPYSIVSYDFNHDNLLDIATANKNSENIAILFGQNDGKFPTIAYPNKTFMWSKRVAVGDFNNDGRLDSVMANDDRDAVDILRGNGDGTLEIQTTLSTGNTSSPKAVAVDDLNNDGRLDILIANFGTNTIGIFFGHGNAQFSSQTTYFMGWNAQPISIVTADFDNNGRPDIVVANAGTDNVCILLADANGNFSSQQTYFTGERSQPVYVTTTDFNHDGRLDIAVVNMLTSTVGILLGFGNGTFQNQTTFSTGVYSYPSSLAVADFNGDDNVDIAVADINPAEEHVLILLGDGHGNFSKYTTYITGNQFGLCSLIVGHFNNDSQLDIAIANSAVQEIGIFLGHGDGTFSSPEMYSTTNGSEPMSFAVGDFNDDNLTDLVVANYQTRIVGIFMAVADTNLIDNITYSTGSAAMPVAIALRDFNNDGQLDIVVGNDGTNNIDLFINKRNGNFEVQIAYVGDSAFHPTSVVVVVDDFDSDNQLDLAVANSATDTVTLLYGKGDGNFTNRHDLSTGMSSSPQSLVAGDFNHDNRTDIAVAYANNQSVGFFLKIDTGALGNLNNFSTGIDSKPHGLTVADFDNDGHLDIAVANNGQANVQFFFGFGNGSFSEPTTIFVGEGIFPQWLGSGDFNNDQHLDVVVSNNIPPTPVIVLLGDGNRSFRMVTTDGVSRTYMGAVGDIDSDGRLDVILSQPWNNAIVILLGHGNGTFRSPTIYPTGNGSFPVRIIVADFNNDSRPDIAVVNPNSQNIGVFLGYGDGTLSDQTQYFTQLYNVPISSAAGDFDNDGQLDIAVGMVGPDSFGVFFGYGNGTFQPITHLSVGSSSVWQWMEAVDFNKDGRLDVIVTDTDSNNLYVILGHANGTFFNRITYPIGNSSYPFSIGLGDFNNDSRIDVAVSNMLSDNVNVLLGYTNVDFVSTAATAIGQGSRPVSIAAGDFNNDTYLDVVVADSGTDNIVVLYGSGDGAFSSQNTQSTGNGSDPNWVAVHDFNHDQHLDIAVVNSGTNNIAIFLGDKDGTFSSPTTYPTGSSSLPVSLTVGHFNDDSHLDLAVANSGNNKVCLMFGNGNGGFTSPECYTSGYDSRPSAVASGDVNGDNLTDVVIANKGSSKVEVLTKIC